MTGRKEGGEKAAETAKERYGDDFHSKIGTEGGKQSGGGSKSNTQNESRRNESPQRNKDDK
jgi:hypothetical protein